MISKSTEDERLVTGATSAVVKAEGRPLKAQGWIKRGPTAYSTQAREFYQWWDRAPAQSEPQTVKLSATSEGLKAMVQ